jgi:hypothetical protein
MPPVRRAISAYIFLALSVHSTNTEPGLQFIIVPKTAAGMPVWALMCFKRSSA